MSDPLDFYRQSCARYRQFPRHRRGNIKAFGERGANCVVNYITDSEGKNKADAKNVAKPCRPLAIECDVTNPAQVESMMMEIGTNAAAWTFSLTTLESFVTGPSRK